MTASAATSVTDTAAFTSITGGTNGTGPGNTGATASTYDLTINGTVIFGGATNVAVGSDFDRRPGRAADQPVHRHDAALPPRSTPAGELTLSNTDGSNINAVQTIVLGAAGGGTGAAAGTGTGATAAGHHRRRAPPSTAK